MDLQSDFDDLFRMYYTKLCMFAHQYVADLDDCHDVVSAAFEEVWRNRATLEMSTARQYLYTSVRNRAIDFLRQQGQRQAYIRLCGFLPPVPSCSQPPRNRWTKVLWYKKRWLRWRSPQGKSCRLATSTA